MTLLSGLADITLGDILKIHIFWSYLVIRKNRRICEKVANTYFVCSNQNPNPSHHSTFLQFNIH